MSIQETSSRPEPTRWELVLLLADGAFLFASGGVLLGMGMLMFRLRTPQQSSDHWAMAVWIVLGLIYLATVIPIHIAAERQNCVSCGRWGLRSITILAGKLTLPVSLIAAGLAPEGALQNAFMACATGIVVLATSIGTDFLKRRKSTEPKTLPAEGAEAVRLEELLTSLCPQTPRPLAHSHDAKPEAPAACMVSSRHEWFISVRKDLLDDLTDAELRAIVAHELGHRATGKYDSILFGLTGLLIVCVLSGGVIYVGVSPQIFGYLFWMGTGAFFSWCLGLTCLNIGIIHLFHHVTALAFARWRERRANDWALEATNDPAAFISAMTCIARRDGVPDSSGPLAKFLTQTHPSLSESVAQASAYARRKNIDLENAGN